MIGALKVYHCWYAVNVQQLKYPLMHQEVEILQQYVFVHYPKKNYSTNLQD